ncbi:TonB-dependent receptor [Sphingomonas koreensis]|uniref:TonB-dependent receptor n=6 Tax=Sphingomonas koreensis TaxID=93064 RepID=A0A1L6J811_9SPHN|nr:TonB-dependent receptor [Sphingomonas koreensis]APR51601.1 TonB-dependent receptor [Sphingomonas koreensis]APR52045.1 TonB-dependent receptor [Sphingomonas koreensis]APR52077.1 TonB-dependent receptor [Sphingomonas koreensis]RSU22850.1 TonB-dependent receptor [Sphingomonas koreensis]RSU30676.1 TonB-dependent receptor [Sphingomonas koreensis]
MTTTGFAHRHIAGLALMSAAIALSAPAMAQETPATETAAEETAPGEIVVTARRRAESLQDVPIAISAYDSTALSNLQADQLSGIQYATPNLYLDQGDAGNAVIYIRGVGQNDSLAFADPGVGVYVDDVFIARSQAAFLDVFDVERIEVLRGPQGTLYGRNTIGGAIKFVSTRPTRDYSAYFEGGIGNYDQVLAKGRISGPLSDTVRGKIAYSWQRRTGYAYNSTTRADDGDVRTISGRASLLFEPSSDFEVLLTGDVKIDRPDTSRSPVRATPITGFANGALVTFPAATDPYRVDTNANGLNDQTGWGTSLTARWNASEALTIEAISAYRQFDFDLNLDTDGSPLPILDIYLDQRQRQFSQEVRGTYAVPDRFAITAGLYYFHDRDVTVSGYDDGAATLFGFPVTAFGFPTSSLADTRQTTDSYAAFADATVELTPQLSLGAGLRYTHEKRSSSRAFEFFFDPRVSVIGNPPPFLQGAGIAGVPISGSADFDALTPRASISYQPNRDLLLYASASRGFKSGGFDGRANSDFGFRPFRPEYVWAYEGGIKKSWAGGRLTTNLAAFYNDYTDQQVTSFGADPVTGVFASLFTNAAAARAYGLEFELAARLADGLDLTGSVGLLDAKYRRFDQLVGGVVTDVSDRRVVNAPDFNASVGLTYTRPLGGGDVSGVFHIDGAYRSTVATEITDSPLLRQPGYEKINAFIGVVGPEKRWELRAGVENLTDQAVRVQGFNLSEFPGVQLGFFAAPRTYDLRLILRY